jgi:hypothetical protein
MSVTFVRSVLFVQLHTQPPPRWHLSNIHLVIILWRFGCLATAHIVLYGGGRAQSHWIKFAALINLIAVNQFLGLAAQPNAL